MATTTPKATFKRGIVEGAPFMLLLIPFGTLFGVVATEAGLPVLQTMIFSVVVIAGAAQFTAISLMQEQAPTLIVIATALAVNLRMAMYSAALAPHLGHAPLWKRALMSYTLVDQSFALSALRFEEQSEWSLDAKIAYFAGVITPVVPFWYLCTFLGAVLGASIPEGLALDFAVPITFLAIIAPALRTAAHVAAAVTSITLALALSWMPFSSGLLVAGLGAMAVGAEVERRMTRASAP